MADLPILVQGAGIGGLTTALQLAQKGFQVIVVEKRTRLEEVGAGLQLSPNASHILIGLGLGKALSRAASMPLSLDVRLGHNHQLLARAPLQEMQNRYGAPYLLIHRADLQQILLDHVRSTPNISLVFGRSIAQLTQYPDHIELSLNSSQQADHLKVRAVIGADGLHSSLAMLMGDQSKAKPSGYQAWRGTLPMAQIGKGFEPQCTTLYLGSDAHAVTYPLRGGDSFNIVLVTREKSHETGWSRPGDATRLKKQLKAWTPLKPLIDLMPEWQVWSLYDRPPRPRWSYGAVTLLGDAAHPVLPFLAQGAALAIEDSAVLATMLSRTPDEPEKAFAAYQALRQPRARKVQDTAHKNGTIYHLPFPLSLARNAVIAHKDAALLDDYAWLYGWRVETTEN